MLKIEYKIPYFGYTKNQVYSDIEKIFTETRVEGTQLVKEFIRRIDKGTYKNNRLFKDRFGSDLSLRNLSTGCKAAIILALGYKEKLDLTECGYNARDEIVKLCTEGYILLDDLRPFSFNERNPEDYKCDIEFNGYRFTALDRFCYYLEEEFDDDDNEPDTTYLGIERIVK